MIRKQKPTGVVKTARGDYLDMNKLASFNEESVAVTAGGVSMNSRGDILGRNGKVIKTREQLDSAYAESLENSTTHISGSSSDTYEQVSIKRVSITPDNMKGPKKTKAVENDISDNLEEVNLEEVNLEDIDSVIEKNKTKKGDK